MSENPGRYREVQGAGQGPNADVKAGEEERGKKPYAPPRITEYGAVRNLTLGFSGAGGSEDPD